MRPNVLEVVLKLVSGTAQVHIVKGVQEVGAELHVRRFGEVEVLHQADIRIEVSRAIRGVPAPGSFQSDLVQGQSSPKGSSS